MTTDIKKRGKKNRPVSEPALVPLKTDAMTEFCQDTADDILRQICAGRMLTEICTEEGTPEPQTVRQWAIADKKFGDRFDQARIMQADVLFEEAVSIGRTSCSSAADRLRVDTLMKAAAIFQPKKYGDKKEISNVVAVNIHTTLNLPDEVKIESGPYKIEVSPEAN